MEISEDGIRIRSPDGHQEAVLEVAGEIRFGPPYFHLRVQDKQFPTRTFGKELVWSPDSRFLLVQEWQSTTEQDGPQTRMVAFDFAEGRECVLAKATHGFVYPIGFLGRVLRYRKSYGGMTMDYEQEWPRAEGWTAISGLTDDRPWTAARG
jgi:hypothetical protein